MAESGMETLIVVLAIIGVIVFNVGLYVTIKSGKRRRNPTRFNNMINTVKNPFGESDKQLEELSRIMKDLNRSKNNNEFDESE